jgi:hypothetical protein
MAEASAPVVMPKTASSSLLVPTVLSEPDVQPVTVIPQVPTTVVATENQAVPQAATAPAMAVPAPAVPVIQQLDRLSRFHSAVPVALAPAPAAIPSVLSLGEGKLSSKGLSCMFCRRTPITGIVPALALGAAAELLVRVSAALTQSLRVIVSRS